MEKYNLTTLIIKNKKLLVFLLFCFSVVVFLCIFLETERSKELEVVFLDIGQGDSSLIKLPEGQNVVIDTGPNYLTNQKLEKNLTIFSHKIDVLILTHPDMDHVGGTEEILKSGNVGKVIESTENLYSSGYFNYNTSVSYINTENYLAFNALKILNMNPTPRSLGSSNHKSIVNLLNYGNFRFIFTGDADSETERSLIFKGFFNEEGKGVKFVNILKVGHHGSDTSSSEVFLKKLKPEYCIISVGTENKYGHPSKKTLERLVKYCKNIYRTDLDGSISFKTDGKRLSIASTK